MRLDEKLQFIMIDYDLIKDMDFSINTLQSEFDIERLRLLRFLSSAGIVKKEDIEQIFNDYKKHRNE